MRWSRMAFALLALHSTFSYGADTLPSLTVSTQYKMETSHFNTWENTALYYPRFSQYFQLALGAQMAVSRSEFESLNYKVEPILHPLSLVQIHLRLSKKLFLPETGSFTHILPFIRLQTPSLGGFRAYTKLGWYYRFWELNRASIFPVPAQVGYTEYDFAVAIGLDFQSEREFFGRFELSTFDEMDVFNFNHPFAELRGGILADRLLDSYGLWALSGLARVWPNGSLCFGFSMDFITDRYWAE